MKQLFTVLLTLVVLTVFGQQESNDCLSPTSPRNFGALKTYEKKVDNILLDQLSDFQLLVFRQSETIWAIELDTTDLKNPGYFITSVRPSKSIWYSMPDVDDITVVKTSKKISNENYELVKELFDSSLNSVCANCNNFGIDGTTYNFSNSLISGKVWLLMPPTNETKKERLVLICKEINKLVNTNSKEISLDQDLRNQITELTEEFNKQNANRR